MLTGFLGRLIIIFATFYLYEKAIQKWDPLLRMPWAWNEKRPAQPKPKRRRPKHLKVVK